MTIRTAIEVPRTETPLSIFALPCRLSLCTENPAPTLAQNQPINSLARALSVGETLSPSALAVLRLMTS